MDTYTEVYLKDNRSWRLYNSLDGNDNAVAVQTSRQRNGQRKARLVTQPVSNGVLEGGGLAYLGT